MKNINLRAGLGPTLRNERLDRRIGLRELARRVGVSPTCVSKLEHWDGQGSMQISAKILSAICKQLGVNEQIVFGMCDLIPPDIEEICRNRPDLWDAIRELSKATP